MSETFDQKPIISVKNQFALVGILLASFAAPLCGALNIGAIIDKFNSSYMDAALVISIESLAISIMSMFIARYTDYINHGFIKLKTIFIIGFIFIIIGNISTIISIVYFNNIFPIYLVRALSGLGTGAIVATVMATVARHQNAQMVFAYINSGIGLATAILFFISSRAITNFNLEGGYFVYLVFSSLLALVFIPIFKLTTSSINQEEINKTSYSGKIGWLALIGVFLIFFAHSGLGIFGERIALSVKITTNSFGNLGIISGVLIIIGPLMAGIIGNKFGSLKPSIILLFILLMSVYFTANSWKPIIFFIAFPIFGLMPIMWTPIFLGAMSYLDQSGRLAAAHPAFVTMAGALSPIVMGYILDNSSFPQVGWIVIAIMAIGIPLIILGTKLSDKIRYS